MDNSLNMCCNLPCRPSDKQQMQHFLVSSCSVRQQGHLPHKRVGRLLVPANKFRIRRKRLAKGSMIGAPVGVAAVGNPATGRCSGECIFIQRTNPEEEERIKCLPENSDRNLQTADVKVKLHAVTVHKKRAGCKPLPGLQLNVMNYLNCALMYSLLRVAMNLVLIPFGQEASHS